MKPDLIEEFRQIPALADLTDGDLEWLTDHSEVITAEPGEVVIRENTLADYMFIFLEGEMDGRREALGPDSPVYTLRVGQISGLLPFSRMTHYTITGRAVTHIRPDRIPKDCFEEMMRQIPALGRGWLASSSIASAKSPTDQSREKLVARANSRRTPHIEQSAAAGSSNAAGMLADAFERHLKPPHVSISKTSPPSSRPARHRGPRPARSSSPPFTRLRQPTTGRVTRAWSGAHHRRRWKFAPTLAETAGLRNSTGSPPTHRPLARRGSGRITATLDITRRSTSSTAPAASPTGRRHQGILLHGRSSAPGGRRRQGHETALIVTDHKPARGINVVPHDPDLPRIDSFGSELNRVWFACHDSAADAMEGKASCASALPVKATKSGRVH
jgi:CRP-like cAMP-binding protein